MIDRLARIAVGLVLLVVFFELADARRTFVRAVVAHDAAPAAGPRLPAGPAGARGLEPTGRVRVVLVDGAGLATAHTMPTWNALCARGLDLTVDVGFPTVSLPVQVALWSGRTQQQTGVLFHSTGKPLPTPLGAGGIPAQVPDSVAVAESHPYIVHSLGFARLQPPTPARKLPDGWSGRWLDEAAAAFAGPSRLAFAHLLAVDTAGHRQGRVSPQWRGAVAVADVNLAWLVAATPADARWFVLGDHDHLPGGGHGGEERGLRIVRACVAGPGIAPRAGGPIHLTDLSRAIADSAGATLADDSPARPLAAALAAPVDDDDVLPPLPRGRVLAALALVLLAAAVTGWVTRGRLARLPWWFAVAIVALVVGQQVPTLSTPMIYPPKGLLMAEAFAPGLAVLAVLLAWQSQAGWLRGVVGALLLPFAVTLAVAILCGALPLILGDAVCPVVPRYTGWLSPLLLMSAAGAAVAGLVALASAVLPPSGPWTPTGSRRSGRAAP